jgi:hypothetical protein
VKASGDLKTNALRSERIIIQKMAEPKNPPRYRYSRRLASKAARVKHTKTVAVPSSAVTRMAAQGTGEHVSENLGSVWSVEQRGMMLDQPAHIHAPKYSVKRVQ